MIKLLYTNQPGVDFSKRFSQREKMPAQSIWNKICHLVSSISERQILELKFTKYLRRLTKKASKVLSAEKFRKKVDEICPRLQQSLVMKIKICQSSNVL
jgi:hypothetical protein